MKKRGDVGPEKYFVLVCWNFISKQSHLLHSDQWESAIHFPFIKIRNNEPILIVPYRAENGHVLNIVEACSWRPDSTRCYPGHCRDELAANCVCTPGFGGHHCEKSKSYTVKPALKDISI